MDLGLTGRRFLVTGGTTGLGRATAAALAAEGARVLVASRSPEHVEAAVAALGPDAAGCVVDLTDDGATGRLLAAADAAFGGLDGAFVSHGGPPPSTAAALSDADLTAGVAIALTAPIRIARDVTATLGPGGAVVVLTSSSSLQPIAGLATSNLARPAVWGYVRTLAEEVGPRGVRVNALVPGRFATARVDELHARTAEARGVTPDAVAAEYAATLPLRRVGDPAELGRVAAFLLSPAASYVTGAAWVVDGGLVRGL